MTMLDVARANIDKNSFCQKQYLLSSIEANYLLCLQYAYIVAALLKLDHLTDYGTHELWSLYKDHCWKFWKVNACERELKQRLQERAVRRDQQRLQKKEEDKQQQLLVQKQKEQEARNQEIYHKDLLHSDYQSPYHDARTQALVKTQKDHYQKYEHFRELDAQTIGLCMAHNIDYQKLQQCAGTAMQHQLYDEVTDCYKKIAKFFCQPTLGQSLLAQQSLEFAQCVTHATELEAMELAIALSDLAHVCTETACSIIAGVNDAVEGIADVIQDPFGAAKNLGCCLGRVMNYVAEAMVHADSEGLGWSHYAQVLEQEHQYDAEYVQQVVDGITSWVVHSSAQDKVRMVTRCIADGILYGNLCKVLSQASKACCGLIADIPELRFLGKFTDVYVEYGLATELGEVGLASMEDVGISFMKSEMKMASEAKLISTKLEQTSGKRVIDEIFAKQEYYKKYKPKEVKTNCLLDKNLKIAEDAKKDAARIRKLPDGRVRFYQVEDLASTPGPTRGATHVTEYNPHRGIVRGWRESYDHNGNVNRVHPKMFNGKNIKALHYPHTGQELKEIASKLKGK